MLIRLDGKSAKAALPDMTARLIVAMVAADVARREPLHPVAEIAVFSRPEDHVEVIGQQAIGQQPHLVGIGCLAKQFDELGIIAGLVEDFGPGISAVENVITKAAGRCPGGSWHRLWTPFQVVHGNTSILRIPRAARGVKEMQTVPRIGALLSLAADGRMIEERRPPA